jgi:DNA-binding MarR family transcriptional regulator
MQLAMTQHPQIATTIRRASQNLERIATAYVKHLGVTYRQILVLISVKHNPGCSQRHITELTGIDRTTVNNIVDTLEPRGLLDRPRNTEDKRLISVSCTDEGAEIAKAGEKILAVFDSKVRDIVKVEHRSLEAAMTKLMEAQIDSNGAEVEEAEQPRRAAKPARAKRLYSKRRVSRSRT